MNPDIISQFIDDELTLDDKIVFVEGLHASQGLTAETLVLLRQEKLLRADAVTCLPRSAPQLRRRFSWRFLRPLGFAAAGVAAALLILFWPFAPAGPPESPYRFVIYRPDAERVDITGSFTGWKAVSMRKAGPTGYWEYTVALPHGEYRFAYLLEDGERLPDPTLPARENDDFDGVNSVLSIGGESA